MLFTQNVEIYPDWAPTDPAGTRETAHCSHPKAEEQLP